jgi:hypothetical protein
MTSQLGTPREGVMNIAASFRLVMKPRYIDLKRKKAKLVKMMLASFAIAPENL